MRAALLALLAAGCTFAPGTGFTTLTEVTLTTVLDPPVFETDAGRTVTVDTVVWTVGPLRLQALEGGTGTFDPANPPPGFTLCHNGHCHADDGTLPTYAEIEAMLAGDAASWRTVVSVPLDPVDALAGAVTTAEVRPSPALPAAAIGHLALAVQAVRLQGTLDDGAGVELDLQLEGLVEGGLALPVDRDTEPEVAVAVTWTLPPTLLDGIDWVDPPAGPDLALALEANLADSTLRGDVE